MTINKVYDNFPNALKDIRDSATIMMDGFGGPGGMPRYLIMALRDQGARDLTIVSNTAGIATAMGFGTPPGIKPIDHSILIENGQVSKVIASFPVPPSPSKPSSFELAYEKGKIDLELVPQGTLAERIRAGGAGIPAFYTPTGVGTLIAKDKETRVFSGRKYLLEYALKADFAFIWAQYADTLGNLVYKGTSRNFNAVMATAATITIAEVNQIVQPGEIDPETIHTPGIYVNRIVKRPIN